MSKFNEIQGYISDIAGSTVIIWAMVLLTSHGAEWPYVALVAMGLTTVVGKRLFNLPMGIGGANDEP